MFVNYCIWQLRANYQSFKTWIESSERATCRHHVRGLEDLSSYLSPQVVAHLIGGYIGGCPVNLPVRHSKVCHTNCQFSLNAVTNAPIVWLLAVCYHVRIVRKLICKRKAVGGLRRRTTCIIGHSLCCGKRRRRIDGTQSFWRVLTAVFEAVDTGCEIGRVVQGWPPADQAYIVC